MIEQNQTLTTLQRFRRKYQRIDYYPHRDSIRIIERLLVIYPRCNTRQLLDLLIEAGGKALFPETKRNPR